MKDFIIVVKKGPDLNLTLASVMFDKFGAKLKHKIVVCDNWIQGFETAKSTQFKSALFVDSGTIITDWGKFADILSRYPHQGLVAHLIWPPGQSLCLDQQCWFMELDKFNLDDFTATSVSHPLPIRSEQNLHDDYTPLWVKADTANTTEYTVNGFGQGLIAKQLQQYRGIVNWNNAIRDIKFFKYPNQSSNLLDKFLDYIQLAETQLWVLNNETITATINSNLLMPGSGLGWILNIIQESVQAIQIVDISRTQIKFCQELWTKWDGNDYGKFAWQFIEQHQLAHYELDRADLSPLERLQLKSKSKFIKHVNEYFAGIMPDNFVELWNHAQHTKALNLTNDNLVTWTLNNDIQQFDSIWCSNILDYKWTLLHTTADEFDQFKNKIS
jgi:hypothetical protein